MLDGTDPPDTVILAGHAGWVFRTAQFWRDYPVLPPRWAALVSPRAALIVALFCGSFVWLLRWHLRLPWLLAGLGCLSISPILYGCILLALRHNTASDNVGPALALSILGSLYALVTCAACCVLQLYRGRGRPAVAAIQTCLASCSP